MKHQTIRGTIRYTSNKPERLGQERGREYFILTKQSDGVQVLHAHCEIDDEPNVIRDVVLSLDKDCYPVDCSVRLSVGDKYEGTGLFRFAADHAECETFNRRDGRISQRIATSAKVRWLGSHPIIGDALGLCVYDLAKGPGREFFPNMMLTSPDHRGATGPGASRSRWLLARLTRCTSAMSTRPVSCPRSIRPTTCGARTMGTTSFSRARWAAICKPATS